ncbi:hypothetical protein FJY71_05585 [candidate division WOR-3 bacterium]|nr:hypothetical protein [candidate division WOR-3 bacterium]
MKRLLSVLCLAGVLAGPVLADVTLADGRLSLGGFVRGRAVYWRSQAEAASSGYEFQKGLSLLWLGASLTEVLSARICYDVSRPGPLDLYAQAQWSSGWAIKAGQFKLPLSFETDTRPDRLKLLDPSLAAWLLKPSGSRDIGALLSWRACDWLEASAAVVNGSGPNAGDANKWKDFTARLVYRSTAGLAVGGTAYYGRVDADGSHWLTGAADALFARGPVRVQAMGLYQTYKDERNLSASLLAAYDFGWVEPVARFDVLLREEQKPEIMPLLGLNFWVLGERFRVTADYQYHRHFGSEEIVAWTYQQLSLQVQAGF